MSTSFQALRYDSSDGCYYWQKGTKLSLSGNFTTSEFECRCSHETCKIQKIKGSLITNLQDVRKEVGSILITSGFRCKEHQKDLRDAGYETAAGTSTHEMGMAADIRAKDMEALFKACTLRFKAIGKAKTFIHVDERRDRVRRWGYTSA